MLGHEAEQARISLGLSRETFAVENNLTGDIVAAWESGRIKVPRHIATDLRWRVAREERLAALAASGLPDCDWVLGFEREPVPDKLEAQAKHMERLVEHSKSCPVCAARDGYIAERFPPMPPAPRKGWLALVLPIAERIQQLPAWAQPAATGASLFVAYSLFRLLFLLPQIVREPSRGLLVAVEGILASASIGAVVGFLYGAYQRIRDRRASRRTA